MKENIYLAAPIFTPSQLEVVNALRFFVLHETPRAEIFSPWHNSQEIFAGRKPHECSPEERAKVLNDNIVGLDRCTILLAWVGGMGGFTDPGVVWEMGYVHCRAREAGVALPATVAYIDDTDTRPSMNLMLAGTVDAVIKGRSDMRDFLNMLGNGMSIVSALRAHPPADVLGRDMDPVA